MRRKLYRGWWYATWHDSDGGTRRIALRTQDPDEAERRLADLARRAARGGGTVADAMAAYLADLPEAKRERPRWAWKRLAPAFGPLLPEHVDRARCRSYVAARRADGAGDGTVHTELTYLRAALRHARAEGWTVELPSKPPPRDHRLTRAQYEVMLAAAEPTPHLHLFLVLALATAGRKEAILALTWDRIDFERGLIALGDGTKRRKGRATVPMTDRARIALEAAAAARTSPYVVEWAGSRVRSIRTAFARVARAAGVPWASPHVLRHTAASWMAEAGVPMEAIAQYLGHEDSRITARVYARFSPTYLRQAARALE